MEIMRELEGEPINNGDDVYKYLKEFENEDREYFIVIGLDTKNKPCFREIAHIGTLNSTIIHPREVFKKAIVMGCNSIIVAHNHPSGNLEASPEDLEVTRILREAGEILQIKVLDSLIITKGGYNQI